MNQIRKLSRWAWSVIVVFSLAFALGGCEGDDGAPGPVGPTGATGPAGPPGPGLDAVEAAVVKANVESCSTCHDGDGDYHQAYYNEYVDSALAMTITDVTSVVNVAGGFDLTVDFSLTLNGAPYAADPATLDKKSFYVVQLLANGDFVNSGGFFPALDASLVQAGAVAGTYTLTQNVAYDVSGFDGGAIVGSIGIGVLDFPDNPYNPAGGRRLRGYVDQATAAFEVGGGTLAAWQSPAKVAGCEACHGVPYRKHANIEAVVAGVPDFTQCKACHSDDRNGGHPEWQYMVDEPLNWATGVPATADYSYTANLMNDVHMSHAMEFPYPMSMSNCATCHEGNLAAALDDSNFRPDVCKSCHVVQGIDAWPEDAGTTLAGLYAQPHRPPPLEFLWARANVETVHTFPDINAVDCAGQCHGGNFSSFIDYHTGYDKTIYDASGNRYSATNTVSVDAVTVAGDLLTVEFSATNVDIIPTLAISFYGWDTKHFIVPAHERDGNRVDAACTGRRPGCNIEWEPGSTKPFFTEEAGSVAGAWIVTFDMAGFQPYKTDPIPQLIADGVVKYIEIAVLPELVVGGMGVNIEAVSTTYDLAGAAFVDDYFQGAGATVAFDKCVNCHDNLSTIVHTGSGRFGDSMQTCKACHATTFDGGHLEMQSRSIDSYVHAIHAFQPLDENDVYDANDPVFTARNEMHKHHAFPNFTSLSCEGCHVAGTYNVPDQSKSMPGAQSASYTLNDPSLRAIGTVPMSVQGAANRACGSCHRAELIKHDAAGELASFDAHTGTFGTFVTNDPLDADGDGLEEEPVLFGIIDKIMSLFE